jgi:hypothetical protein
MVAEVDDVGVHVGTSRLPPLDARLRGYEIIPVQRESSWEVVKSDFPSLFWS